ncbi:unnamed protein product [Clonostachys solani]|uniref:Aminotransferase class I/classII domain-containing protein n=1 Tax=Clonostachys solani TaxID=160281 RepID=A0A9N9ZPA0_9HYPO|nr:unnamed protein product [Clonostachys solani]
MVQVPRAFDLGLNGCSPILNLHLGKVLISQNHRGLQDTFELNFAPLTFKLNDKRLIIRPAPGTARSGKIWRAPCSTRYRATERPRSPRLLQELIDAAKEILTHDNALFIIDEAYGTGILGPKGLGLVCELGLEKEVGIRLHTFPKALDSTGSAILANETVQMMLMNNAQSLLITGVPSFPMLASIRAAYRLVRSASTIEVQHFVKLFLTTIRSHPVWERASSLGILRIPLHEGDDDPDLVTQILPIWTRAKHNLYLAFHVNQANFSGYPVVFPVVPKGQE